MPLYGGGTLNVFGGSYAFLGTATGNKTVTMKLNGLTTGYSNATTAGTTVVHGGITINAANLDAASGASGFGGYAYGGGAAIVATGAQP
jgi:hypothetical protein